MFIIHPNTSWGGSNINHVNGNDNRSELKVNRFYFLNPHMCVSKLKVGGRERSASIAFDQMKDWKLIFPNPLKKCPPY